MRYIVKLAAMAFVCLVVVAAAVAYGNAEVAAVAGALFGMSSAGAVDLIELRMRTKERA